MWSLLFLLTAIALLYQYIKRHYTHWQREGLVEDPARIPFGNLESVVKRERAMGCVINDIYNRHTAKMVGIYLLHKPTLLIRDPELMSKILATDFGSFHDRGFYIDEKDELSGNLFNFKGATWRNMRLKLAPTFSSGKIKGMFAKIDEVGQRLVDNLFYVLEQSDEIEMRDTMTTYALDIIGSVIFGLEINSFSDPHNEFRTVIGNLFKEETIIMKIHGAATFLCPTIAKFMNRLGFRNRLFDPIRDIVKKTVEFRERNNVVRKDMLQLLIRLRNTGKVGEDDDKVWNMETASEEAKSMSIDKLAAQTLLFYVAGTETTAAAAAFTLYELAMYPELLREARQEVDAVLKRHNLSRNGELTYEAIQDLKFLDQCVLETIRKYPGVAFILRECNLDYPVPGENYTIKKGTTIVMSALGIQRDPNYFPNPNGYDPHRFDADVQNYNETAFMPFGVGPRHCIAQRLGKVNSKVALVKILANFDIAQEPQQEVEFKFDQGPFLIPEGGLKLRLKKRV